MKFNLIFVCLLFSIISICYGNINFSEKIYGKSLVKNQHNSILQDDEIEIGYIIEKFPWCHASMEISYSMNSVLAVIKDVENYYKFFDSLSLSKQNTDDVVHIRIDMPLPFSDRDYTVVFDEVIDGNEILYSYKAVVSKDFPEMKNCVRLVNAQGEWYLYEMDNNKTYVRYTWNGQMLGDFPKWGYKQAWTRQGNEIISCLAKEVERRYNAQN